MQRSLYLVAIGLLLMPASKALADTIQSTFNANAEGWSISGDGTGFHWASSGGNPGGHIAAQDIVASNTWFFEASSQYYGNRSHFYGGTLSFDLKQALTDSQYNDRDVLLTGGGITLAFDTATNPGANWTSYGVNLTEAGWKVGNITGAAATQAQFQTVLADLTNLRIRGEYRVGSDSAGLDNVKLFTTASAPVPLPAAAWGGMALLGMIGAAKWSRRR